MTVYKKHVRRINSMTLLYHIVRYSRHGSYNYQYTGLGRPICFRLLEDPRVSKHTMIAATVCLCDSVCHDSSTKRRPPRVKSHHLAPIVANLREPLHGLRRVRIHRVTVADCHVCRSRGCTGRHGRDWRRRHRYR